MLSRRKSWHKSTPSLLSSGPMDSGGFSGESRVQHPYGRDELVENYLDLRDQHQALRKEANKAREEVRLLQVRLNRLVEEKKRHFRLHRTEREISLEEIVHDLEHRMEQQARQNGQLKQKLHLLQLEKARPLGPEKHRRISSAVNTGARARPVSVDVSGTLRKQVTFGSTQMSEARTLLAEAKNEILRLECLAEEQQELLESLLEESRRSGGQVSSSQQTYQLTTTTTTLSAGTVTHPHPHTPGMEKADVGGVSSLEELLGQYQAIMLQTEASSRMGGEVRALMERLHRALQEERQTAAQLRAQLNANSVSVSELTEKDRQIAALRKENHLLQESMQNCMEKCMAMVDSPAERSHSAAPSGPRTSAELSQLRSRLALTEAELERERRQHSALAGKHNKLQQLSDNDQLQLRHLEEKIERLTRLVFAQELDSETETITEPETISAQLDQLLNSIVKG